MNRYRKTDRYRRMRESSNLCGTGYCFFYCDICIERMRGILKLY